MPCLHHSARQLERCLQQGTQSVESSGQLAGRLDGLPFTGETQRIAIIEEFAPRFAPGAVLVYMGDTAKKNLIVNTDLLERLKIPPMNHDKLPDVVL